MQINGRQAASENNPSGKRTGNSQTGEKQCQSPLILSSIGSSVPLRNWKNMAGVRRKTKNRPLKPSAIFISCLSLSAINLKMAGGDAGRKELNIIYLWMLAQPTWFGKLRNSN